MSSKKIRTEKRGFIWYALRISFWAFVSGFVLTIPFMLLSMIFEPVKYLYYFSAYIFIFSVPLTLIFSVIHLIKYKKKVFAIIALAISMFFLAILIWLFSSMPVFR